MDEEKIEQAVMKQLRMKGLLLADVEIVRAMDREMEGESLIIPARINKEGTLGRSSAISMEQFSLLRNHVRNLLARMGKELLRGDVSIRPYRKGNGSTACKHCDYAAVCQFDSRMAGNGYRVLAGLDAESFWKRLKEERGKADG